MFPQADLSQWTVAPSIHWMEAFGQWLQEHDRRPNTVSAYLQDVRHFAKFFQRENDQMFMPGLLNATDIKKYFARQDADKDVAPTSRNRRLASLRVLVEWSVAMGLLEYDPTVCIKRESVEPNPRDRTHDEMSRLDGVINNGSHLCHSSEAHKWLGLRDRALWILMADAGLRIHEVSGLDVGDLDFDANKIRVMGKGGKKAEIPVSPKLLDEMRVWLDVRCVNSTAVITDQNGTRITTGQIRRRVKMIGRAAGINDLKPHDLRHTFAYTLSDALMAQGLPMQTAANGVRKQLRHGDIKTTMLYFGVRESQIRAAMEVM